MHEQLKTYLSEWRVLLHVKEAVSISSKVSKLLSKALHDPHRIANAPSVPNRQLKPQALPSQGLLPITGLPSENSTPAPPLTALQESEILPYASANTNSALITTSNSSAAGPAIQHVLTPGPVPRTSQMLSTASTTADRAALNLLAHQRVVTHIQQSKPAKKDRKRRTCSKCALVACPGSQRASNCRNKCRDCGEASCRGRNSKRLQKTCREGWDP